MERVARTAEYVDEQLSMSPVILLLLLAAILTAYFTIDGVLLEQSHQSEDCDEMMTVNDINAFGVLIRDKALMFILVLIIFNMIHKDVYARVVGNDDSNNLKHTLLLPSSPLPSNHTPVKLVNFCYLNLPITDSKQCSIEQYVQSLLDMSEELKTLQLLQNKSHVQLSQSSNHGEKYPYLLVK